jgi:DNA-binding response OmpR family regulator
VIPSVVLLGERAIAGFEGLDVVASMRARFGEPIPAIVLSEDDDKAHRAPAPSCWYLSKPIRFDRLRSLLNHLLTEATRSAS